MAAVSQDEKARINVVMSSVTVARPVMHMEGVTDKSEMTYTVPCLTNSRVIQPGEILRVGTKRQGMVFYAEDEQTAKKLKLSSGSSSNNTSARSSKGRGKVAPKSVRPKKK